MVYTKCEGNPWVVSTCISGSRHRKERKMECSQKDMYREKKNKFAVNF